MNKENHTLLVAATLKQTPQERAKNKQIFCGKFGFDFLLILSELRVAGRFNEKKPQGLLNIGFINFPNFNKITAKVVF